MKKVLSRLAKVGRSSSQAAEPPDRGSPDQRTGVENHNTRPAAYDVRHGVNCCPWEGCVEDIFFSPEGGVT